MDYQTKKVSEILKEINTQCEAEIRTSKKGQICQIIAESQASHKDNTSSK
jgi:hypothetical protein